VNPYSVWPYLVLLAVILLIFRLDRPFQAIDGAAAGSGERFAAIDGLRGLLAFGVFGHHAVRITVWRSPEMSGEFRIAADGALIHPLYRSVRVAGVALPEVETRLRTFIEQYQTQPQFVAEPLLRVAIGGEIEKPNLYFLRPDVTVTEAVALAGGPTVRGRRDRVRVLADGRVRLIRLDGSDPAGHAPIRSGDQLIVERRGSLFREIVAPVIGVAGAVAAIVNVSRGPR